MFEHMDKESDEVIDCTSDQMTECQAMTSKHNIKDQKRVCEGLNGQIR